MVLMIITTKTFLPKSVVAARQRTPIVWKKTRKAANIQEKQRKKDKKQFAKTGSWEYPNKYRAPT